MIKAITATLFASLLLSSVVSLAAMDMEKMMQQAEAAQACFEKIDESKLMALEQQGRKMEQEINALCKAGKSAEATSKAIEFSLKMQKDPNIKQIQECAKYMEGMPIPKPNIPIEEGETEKTTSVCE